MPAQLNRIALLSLFAAASTLQGCASAPVAESATQSAPVAAAPTVPVQQVVEAAIDGAVTAENRQAVAVHDADGSVLITGQVLSEEEKSKVSNAIAFAAGRQLRRLTNELRVVESIDLSLQASDASLAAAAASLLTASDAALGQQVQVVAENAQVFLLGRVTRAQGDAAAQLVSRLQGVAAVRTLFDYTD
jgi:osmotically-inducible protein OsmY